MKKNLTPAEKKIYKDIIFYFSHYWKMMLYWSSVQAKEEHPDVDTSSIANTQYSKINALIDILSMSFGLNYRILFNAAMDVRFKVH